MIERPILFNAPMVRAILEGRKVQTRRVVKADLTEALDFMGGYIGDQDPPGVDLRFGPITGDDGKLGKPQWLACCADYPEEGFVEIGNPYGAPGDRLWVRETWMPDAPRDGTWPDTSFYGCKGAPLSMIPEVYRKPEHCLFRSTWNGGDLVGWRPSIHMPRWASRILLEVAAVRVERLQSISDADAQAEGVGWSDYQDQHGERMEPREAFAALWEQLNGPGSWEANPWVWAVQFRRVGA